MSSRQMNSRQMLVRTALCCALLLVCIWPALYNGQPLFFVDTTAYIRGADAGFTKVTHHRTVWSGEEGTAAAAGDLAAKPGIEQGRPSMSSLSRKVVLAGRSIYYGALLYGGGLTGRFWPAILLQAAAVLLAIGLTLHTVGLFTWWRFSLLSVVLAAVTPMAFFVSYLMPDIFAAIAILAVANLLSAGHRMSRPVILVWAALLSASLLFHTSNVLITLLLLVAGVAGLLVMRAGVRWTAVAAIAAAMLVGMGGDLFFNRATQKLVGAPPLRPPFLMARMIMDGPGYRYLLAHCPDSGFAICQFAPRIPGLPKFAITRPPSDEFLWNTDPAAGVFAAADPDTQRRLANEQTRFAVATVAFDPAGVLAASARDTLEQVRLFSVEEFAFDAGARDVLAAHVPEPYLKTMESSRIWHGSMPLQGISQLTTLATILAVLFIGGCLFAWKRVFAPPYALLRFSLLILAGMLVNAIVCGAISTPHDRYEARVIWLLPLTAILIQQSLSNTVWKRGRVKRNYDASSQSAGEAVRA